MRIDIENPKNIQILNDYKLLGNIKKVSEKHGIYYSAVRLLISAFEFNNPGSTRVTKSHRATENPRNIQILNDYKSLGTFRKVADKHNLSIERIRQIVTRLGYKKQKAIKLSREEKRAIKEKNNIVKFWNNVDKKDNGCWEWKGSKIPTGYGHLNWETCRNAYAHRVSWILANGEIPDGLCVLHRCDNPPCVNPDHLFLGTMADNIRDRDAKERGKFGKNRPSLNKTAY